MKCIERVTEKSSREGEEKVVVKWMKCVLVIMVMLGMVRCTWSELRRED